MPTKIKLKWQLIPIIILLLVLVCWLVVEVGGVLTLEDITKQLNEAEKITVAIIIVVLLASDILIPIPSTIVMPVAGNILGLFWGTVLTTFGSMIASLIGYWIGKIGGRPLAQKFIPEKELQEMEQWTKNNGKWPVILAKTMPMMAETVAISVGIAKMSLPIFCVYTLVGTVTTCLAYVIAGNNASSVEEILIIAFGGFVIALVAGIAIRRKIKKNPSKE